MNFRPVRDPGVFLNVGSGFSCQSDPVFLVSRIQFFLSVGFGFSFQSDPVFLSQSDPVFLVSRIRFFSSVGSGFFHEGRIRVNPTPGPAILVTSS